MVELYYKWSETTNTPIFDSKQGPIHRSHDMIIIGAGTGKNIGLGSTLVSPSGPGPPMFIFWVLDFKAIRGSSKILGTSFSSPISPLLCFQDKCLLPCRGLFLSSLKNALAPGLSVSDSVLVNFFILSGMRY